MKGLIKYRPDYCFKCKTTSIELYDYFNNPMKYSVSVTDMLNNKPVSYPKGIYSAKCKICKTIYGIEYINEFPYPVRDPDRIKVFLRLYAEESSNNKNDIFEHIL